MHQQVAVHRRFGTFRRIGWWCRMVARQRRRVTRARHCA